jgi:hypothetical protein
MLGFFRWFRGQIKSAVVDGVNDALLELNVEHADDQEPLNVLRERMGRPPPAITNGKTKKSADAKS